MIVGGDIGGTKADLALFEIKDGALVPVEIKTYASAEFCGVGKILETFLESLSISEARVCLGLPGPVRQGVCQTTNLPWLIDAAQLAGIKGVAEIILLNDLEAAGYGLNLLTPKDLVELNPSATEETGNRVLVSAGTGLGEAILFWDGEDWRPSASEGSHADFAPRNETEWGLFQYLLRETDHPSYDRLVSGPGLKRIYDFLAREMPGLADPDTARDMARGDAAAVIAERAMAGPCPVCREALALMISLYGAEAGNLALKALALGGVYLGGGISPKILPALEQGGFMKSFAAKGRMAELLSPIPVRVVMEPRTSLWGAGYFAWKSVTI